ncbi:bifunctional epoxide hydrolase 2-like protein [Tanacetum coccineum]
MEDIDHKAIKVNSLNMHIIQMGEDKVFVVGHDWGAIIVWQFCLFRPDKVKGLVNSSVRFSLRNPGKKDVLICPLFYMKNKWKSTRRYLLSRVMILNHGGDWGDLGFLFPRRLLLVSNLGFLFETTFVGVESRVLNPETTVLDTLVYPSDTLVIRKLKLE